MGVDTRVSLRKLEVFRSVVELGGVGRAAEHLFVAQPVVSSHLRTLEERLGVQLFYRDGRRMRLTDVGKAVNEWAEDVLTRTRQMERDLEGFSEGSKGSIALGASMSVGSYLLPDVLTEFWSEFPGVRVSVSVSDTGASIEEARRGAVDFSVVATEPGAVFPGMHAEQIGIDQIVLVCAADSRHFRERVGVDELGELPFVEAPGGTVGRAFIDNELRRIGVDSRQVVLEVGHPEAMKRATRNGLGVALLFRSAVRDELAAGSLREMRIEGAEVAVPVSLIYRTEKTFPAIHTRLIQTIRRAWGGAGDEEPLPSAPSA